MIKRYMILVIGLMLSLMCVGPGRCEPLSTDAPSWEHYKVLTQNNIFLRDRASERPRERTVAPVVPVRTRERDFVVTGIVRRDSGSVAFIEDMSNGETLRVRSGDSIADGTIVDIKLDRLVYRKGDQTQDVETGSTLEGTSSRPAPTAASPSIDDGVTPDVTAASPNEAAILERLRQRREKELKAQ